MSGKIISILLTFLILFAIFYYKFGVEKKLKIVWPNGGEKIRAGSTVTIKWKSSKIGRVDIFLVKEGEQKKYLIGEGIEARNGKYNWEVLIWQEPRQDYKILIIESSNQKNFLFDYSDNIFAILGPKFFSCDQLSLENNAPFLSGNYPGIKRIFLTKGVFTGNLGSLENADKICQEEAEKRGFNGQWKAFLGDENVSAKERLNLDGIFVDAEGVEVVGENIPDYFASAFKEFIVKKFTNPQKREGYLNTWKSLESIFSDFLRTWNQTEQKKFCYRLLGRDYDEFINRLEAREEEVKYFFGEQTLNDLKTGVWLGRIEPTDRKECVSISEKDYSFTTTCGNWTQEKKVSQEGEIFCYDPKGNKIKVTAIGGRSLKLIQEKEQGGNNRFNLSFGNYCNEDLRLICIEQ